MTDLMIFSGKNKIAIDAKYTEYLKIPEKKVSDWLNGEPNRDKVLHGWWEMIANFRCDANVCNDDIEYQFLHRTASACKGTKKAIVIYQLFYDKETYESLELFKQRIAKYVAMINPTQDLNFYVWEIETALNEGIESNIFKRMKDVYTFGKENWKHVK
jgi:hypothetical protein